MSDVIMTRIQLITQAIDNLGVLAEGQTADDASISKVDILVDPMFADLAARDIAYCDTPGQRGPTGGEIDPACFLWFAAILADCAKSPFGQAADPSLYVLRTQAEDALKTIGRAARTKRTLRIDPILRRGVRRGYFNYTTGR